MPKTNSPLAASPHVGGELLVNLDFLLELPGTQFPLSHDIQVKSVFPIVDPPLFIGILNCFRIEGFLIILSDTLNSLEYFIGRKTDKLLNAAVADNSRIWVSRFLRTHISIMGK